MPNIGDQILGDIAEAVDAGLLAMTPAAEALRKSIYERGQSGRAVIGANPPYGQRWARERTKRGLQTGNPDLWFTGGMFNSFKVMQEGGQALDPRGRGSRIRDVRTGRFSRPVEIVLGFDKPVEARKAAAHEFGLGNVPARPFLGFTPQDADAFERIIFRAIDERLASQVGTQQIEIRVF